MVVRAWARSVAAQAHAHRPMLDLLRILPQASVWGTVALFVQIVAIGLLPMVSMFGIGALVGTAGGGPSTLPGIHNVGGALLLIAAFFLLSQITGSFLGPSTERLAYRLDLLLRERMLRAVLLPPTIAHLEDPDLAEEFAQARVVGTEQVHTTQVVGLLLGITVTRLTALAAAVVLASYRWWAPLLLAGAWVFANDWHRREAGQLVSSLEGSTASFRRARYLGDVALGGTAAKELRIFGLGQWLPGRFEMHWRMGMREAWGRRGKSRWALLVSAGSLVAAHVLVLGLLTESALHGGVPLARLVIYAQAVLAMVGLGWNSDSQYSLRLGIAPLPHVTRLCEAAERLQLQLPGSRAAQPPRTGIRFEGVSFAYPGTDGMVLRNLDLRLPAERSLAIVGENGSGKTTLLKLLCRFYDPTGGRITVDGVDLTELDAASWQRQVAAVFQDFGRYPLSAHDNVVFGNLERRHDEEALQRAAAAAGAAGLVERLPAGWDTPLSRQFPGGIDPSGGQWQRLALARVFFAVEGGARVLVLDEPTASLDIRAEAEFYERFLDLTRGLTTIVVSHRFSTVRRADCIVVLDGGRVVETGSHHELMALGNRYATMFELQAAAYRESSHA